MQLSLDDAAQIVGKQRKKWLLPMDLPRRVDRRSIRYNGG
jgi:hypothetical protein